MKVVLFQCINPYADIPIDQTMSSYALNTVRFLDNFNLDKLLNTFQ